MAQLIDDYLTSRYAQWIGDLEAFGHRGSATANEHRAAAYLLGQMQTLGLDAHKEQFAGSHSAAVRLLAHVAVAVGGLAFLRWMPAVTAVLAIVALASLIAEHMTLGIWLSRPFCRAVSHNVIGRVPARGTMQRRLVLCAHYDTQPTGWVWAIARLTLPIVSRGPAILAPPMLPLMVMMLAQVVLAAGDWVIHDWRIIAILATLLLVAYSIVALLLAQWAMGQYVPGVADNASGVAASLALATDWLREPPADDVELLVLLPGCEECGLLGSAAWADRHREELRAVPTIIVNLDGLGFGPPRFLGVEVPAVGVPLRVAPALVELCALTANEKALADAGPHMLPGPTDTLSFLARGLPAVSVVGFAAGSRLPNYHTMNDTAKNMNFPAAMAGINFAKAIAWKLAGGNSLAFPAAPPQSQTPVPATFARDSR